MNYSRKIILFTLIFISSGLSGINIKLEAAIKNSDVYLVRDILAKEQITKKDCEFYLSLADEIIKFRRDSIQLLLTPPSYEGEGWPLFFAAGGLSFIGFGILLGGPIKEDWDNPFIPRYYSFPIFLAAIAAFKKANKLGFWRVTSQQKYENALTIKRLIFELNA